MAISIVQQIIREDISDQIALNIIDLKDHKEIWDMLKSIYTKVDLGLVYFIL